MSEAMQWLTQDAIRPYMLEDRLRTLVMVVSLVAEVLAAAVLLVLVEGAVKHLRARGWRWRT